VTKTIPFEKLADGWRKDPTFTAEYDALEDEFTLASVLVRARAAADMSQHDIAAQMGTSQPAIARLEGGRSNPSLATLRRYASAVGAKLVIGLEQADAK
jgi:ribosome-binding protein aMBF1 (putative translation factor)